MPAATRVIHTPARHRSHHSTQYPLHSWGRDRYRRSLDSDTSESVRAPDENDLRRIRAELHKISPASRRTKASRMESETSRRRHSESRDYSTKGSRVVTREIREVREVHRKHEPEKRHHRRKSKGTEYDDEGSVHVHRTTEGRRRSEGSVKPTIKRTSTHGTKGGKSRHEHEYDYEHERPRVDSRERPRRLSGHRSSTHHERSHTPSRHGKRSVSDEVPRARERVIVAR